MVNKIMPWFNLIFIEPSRSLHYIFQHSPLIVMKIEMLQRRRRTWVCSLRHPFPRADLIRLKLVLASPLHELIWKAREIWATHAGMLLPPLLRVGPSAPCLGFALRPQQRPRLPPGRRVGLSRTGARSLRRTSAPPVRGHTHTEHMHGGRTASPAHQWHSGCASCSSSIRYHFC